MIKATIIKDQYGKVVGFNCDGHAGHGKYGTDIVCAAVSALVTTTVNSIECLTNAKFKASSEEGHVEFIFTSEPDEKALLLVESLFLGLKSIEAEYGKKHLTVE